MDLDMKKPKQKRTKPVAVATTPNYTLTSGEGPHWVVSFSGGRTSAELIGIILDAFRKGTLRGTLEFIFMDTAAEHPKTYEFIKQVVEHYGIKLTCLQGQFDQPVGVGHTYKLVDYRDLKQDLDHGPFATMMRKYGIPTVKSAWCTSRMKEEVQIKYCEDVYGRGNFETVIGLRYDEPKRLVGDSSRKDISTYAHLRSEGYDDHEITELFLDIKKRGVTVDSLPVSDKCKALLSRRFEIIAEKKLHFMAEFSDFEKSDVLKAWRERPFDLGIEEHLGNCVFCIKKSVGKVALATKDEPELAQLFIAAVEAGNSRSVKEGSSKGEMYRGKQSLAGIIATFALVPRDELRASLRSMDDPGGCSESCEAFAGGEQMELDMEAA